MKNIIIMLSIGIALASCSSNKKTVTTSFDPANNPYYVKKERKGKKESGEVNDPKVQGKINTIIETHLGISITSIAMSPITITDSGYYWKFMNVRNGRTFIGSTDHRFGSVKIVKNNRKVNTQISDF